MLLSKLETSDFRNITGSLPTLCEGINLLCGQNAAGKTNTLEAIYLFAYGKSFRTPKDRDMICHGKDYARAKIFFTSRNINREMSVTLARNGTKRMCIYDNPVDRVSEFLGLFRAVLFTPDHLTLVKGSPEERRKLIDSALCQIRPLYVKSLNGYSKVLEQRNAYLKDAKISRRKVDSDYLDVLTRQIAKSGGVIMKQRGQFCNKLSDYASQMYARVTGERESLFASYVSPVHLDDTSDENANEERLYKLYERSLDRDIELGRTSYGVQRDDLMIFIGKNKNSLEYDKDESGDDTNFGEYAARTFGSQGQQRSAVLAIKLAEGEIMKEKCGEYPVFLLDDLFSELDEGRRQRLSGLFCDRQCVVTCCDKSHIPVSGNVNLVNVENGVYQKG